MKKLGVSIAAVLLFTSCSGGSGEMLDSTEMVCDEFAAHAKAGLPQDSRAEVVESMGEIIGNADQKVQDAYDGLANTVGSNDSAYQLASDAFAQSCLDWGWDG